MLQNADADRNGSAFLSLAAFAAAADTSIATVQRAIARGELASLRLGRRRLIPRSELERLLQRAEQSRGAMQ